MRHSELHRFLNDELLHADISLKQNYWSALSLYITCLNFGNSFQVIIANIDSLKRSILAKDSCGMREIVKVLKRRLIKHRQRRRNVEPTIRYICKATHICLFSYV